MGMFIGILLGLALGMPARAGIVAGLRAHQFTCVTAKQLGVKHCRGMIEGYSQPVHIFVPVKVGRHPALLYYFHGFWLDDGTNPFSGERGNFAASLAESRVDVIAIVPESRGKNVDYRRELATSAQIDAFVVNTEDLLFRVGVPLDSSTPKLLAGHSGAYVTLAQIGDGLESQEIPSLANVVGFAMLDCGYDYRPGLNKIVHAMCVRRGTTTHFQAHNPADSSRTKHLVNERVYREARRDCPKANIIYLQEPDLLHMDFPRHFLGQFLNSALSGEDQLAQLLQPTSKRRPAGLTRAVTSLKPLKFKRR